MTSSSQSSPTEPAQPRRDAAVLGCLWLMVFASSSQAMVVAPIMPEIGGALGIDESAQGALIAAYSIALSLFALIIGPISDRAGRFFVLALGTGSLSLSLALHAFAGGYWTLLGLRAAAGACGGVLTGVAVAYVGDYFPYERRGWANGWVMSGFSVGQIAGVPAGKLLADAAGYRAPFLAYAAVAAAAFVMVVAIVPRPTVVLAGDRISVRGALRSYASVLRLKVVRATAVVYALLFFHTALVLSFLPTWLEASLDASARQVAIAVLAGGVASAVAGPLAGRLSDRVGRRPLILASCLAGAAAVAAWTVVVRNLWLAYAGYFALMALYAMRVSPFQALISSAVPAQLRGTTLSLVVALGHIGGGIAGAVAGALYERYAYAVTMYIAGGALIAAALLVWVGVGEPESESPT